MLSLLFMILFWVFCWYATLTACGSTRLSVKDNIPEEVEKDFPALKPGYFWDVRKAYITSSRVYLMEEGGFLGSTVVGWHPYYNGMGDMADVNRDYERWYRQASGTLANAMGYTLYCNPHTAARK